MKDTFGWLISVCRRWALGSSYNNKTSRAKLGLSLICALYMLGAAINLILFIEPMILKSIPKELLSILLIILICSPALVLFKLYPPEVVDAYVEKYKPKCFYDDIKQQLLALLFCLGGWLALFGPFISI
ncbi:hypothetical protein PSECIP111951_04180 [Pseudoalteromonas holothuriae]|uniref:Uncharacterized protein n=1 Tax=Pseudoalteromonas holothuriae TaxID=2963714 RepID=A0ABM9GNS4_9GAMM|nr:hypothetical protein [Pseudoalteromonas sp. CIP111951]CAH9068521.1 hypothetical protein PSECIP111951_04180 [Pseudoalteromonas sp. CIP111951]